MCFQCFSSLFQIYFIIFSIDFRQFFLPFFFRNISKGVLYSKMHFWGWIWPATLLWKILLYLLYGSSLFYNQFFPEMIVQGDQFTTKSTHLSFRRTTKRNIVLHTSYVGCCQYQSQQFGWSMTWLTGGPPKMEKNGLICSNPLTTQEKTIMANFGPLQQLWGKKGSDHIREILNPYGENPNYGKNGDRRAPVY